MARSAAAAALVLIAAALALAAAASDEAGPERPRGVSAARADLPYPGLRAPGELARPRQRTEAPTGVYPALSSPAALAFPAADALAKARRYARSRKGRVSFAVLDDSGALGGSATRRVHQAASLVKAMILVANLRRIAAEEREPTALERERMGDMIRVSDNFSATQLFDAIGPEALTLLARQAGMENFETSFFWGNSLVSAGDQARFFMALDTLVPAKFRDYAFDLLETVASFHAWGIPSAARPAWRVFFKGGWRPDDNAGEIVHQAALLQRGGRRIAIAVLTDLNPSEVYGRHTINGIALRLVRTPRGSAAPVRGVLTPLPALDGYRAPDPKPLRRIGA